MSVDLDRCESTPNQPPSVGRIVHVVRPDGAHRPAIVVRTWPEITAYQHNEVNLVVFLDGRNDGSHVLTNWETSVPQDESPTPQVGTWHWPERV